MGLLRYNSCMDPLHATIEEFAAEGLHAHRVLLPALPRDPLATNELAAAHLDGAHACSTLNEVALR